MFLGKARSHWAILALLAIAYLYNLHVSGILGPDEARYAAIGLEMARSGDWVTPVLWGNPWFEKPPLTYWLVASGASLGLPDEWAARLPIAVLGVGLAALLPSLEATLVLATSLGWFALSQVAVTDVPLTVCFHLWMIFTLRGRQWVAGLFLGLAVLAKGPIALILALPVGYLYRQQWRAWVLAGGIALPWYIACYARNGQIFLDEFFWKHNVGRFLSPELQHVQPFWFYLPVLLGIFLPWSPLLFRWRWDPEDRPYLWTAVWGFLFFSLSKNKLPTYLLPILPSLAMLASRRLRSSAYASAAAIFAILPAFALFIPPAIESGIGSALGTPVQWHLFFLVILAGGIAHRSPKWGLVISFLVTTLFLKTTVSPDLAGRVTAKGRVKVCVPDGSSRGFRYSLYFYAGREVPDCPPPAAPLSDNP